jgi:hypothetical protein
MRATAAAILVVAPLTLAACGGSKHKQPSVSPTVAVRQAAAKTAAQPSEHMTLAGTINAAGQQASVNGSGDFKGRNGTLQITFSAGGLVGKADAVLVGPKLYLRSPLLATRLTKGKTWLKVDLASAAGNVGGMSLSSLAAESPAQTLRQLAGLRNVSTVGSEQVDGTSTTHYRGTAAAGAGAAGTYDVWVGNDDGLIHRLKLASKLGPNETLDATIDLSDFGKAVTITVPPASQTQTGG